MFKIVLLFLAAAFLRQSEGHGLLTDPPARNTAWRTFPGLPPNYDDNSLYCGGLQVMIANRGCGLCGDNLADPRPRPHENTGKYGLGTVVREYISGQVIDVSVTLTANHLGDIQFSLCDIGDGTQPESGEECFRQLLLEDGTDRVIVTKDKSLYEIRVKLPDGFAGERFVLRWTYRAANSWGVCADGTGAIGCGDQETFKNCADIRIV